MDIDLLSQKAGMLKAYRSAVRLKHSLKADDEIRKGLPKLEASINAAIAYGQPFEYNPGSVFFDEDDF